MQCSRHWMEPEAVPTVGPKSRKLHIGTSCSSDLTMEEAAMSRYYFTLDDPHDRKFTDEEWEDFGTPGEAITHALFVANELGRHNVEPVILSVVRADYTLLG